MNKLKDLLAYEFQDKGRVFFMKISSIVCDAPARAFIKHITVHGGYITCERYEVQGTRLHSLILNKQVTAPFIYQLNNLQ